MPVEPKLVPVGSVAPDFILPSAGGGQIALTQYREKVCVVLVFLRGFQ